MGRASKGRKTAEAGPGIIMVRPQLGENLGMAARAMLNCGLSSLRRVSPPHRLPNERAQRAAPGGATPPGGMAEHATRPANKEELQGLFDHLERALDQSGFLRHKDMRPSMVLNLRALLQRAKMTEQEARTFHGVIKFLSKH